MALVLKRIYQGYFYIFNELADPRTEDLFLMSSPLPTTALVFTWFMFIFKWGPSYMKDREPLNLKKIMIVYNTMQVFANAYILYYCWEARNVVSWKCAEVDYSESYWGLKFLRLAHFYYLIKMADLLDTVFFVLRKKDRHLSFLHIYHHFGMVLVGWVGTKFVGGGQAYFLGLANCLVHVVLYAYYLLTAYDSKYSKLLWLKKMITQLQLIQFVFLFFCFAKLPFISDCNFPKVLTFFFIPQNFFMIILFSDFYIRSYHLEPRRKRREMEIRQQELLQEQISTEKKKDF